MVEVSFKMKILVVASYNRSRFAPFILEQATALQNLGNEIEYFGLQGKGLKGYLKNLPDFKKKIKEFDPDGVHAHFGLSGLFANLQRKKPVVTTYHGSDVNESSLLPYSKLAMHWSAWNVFVSRQTLDVVHPKRKFSLLPCGIEINELQLMGKSEARQKMHLTLDKYYVLFAGSYEREVKNAPLAKEAVSTLPEKNVELLELKGYSHEEVIMLMCAVDALLLTSLNEGSPQVVKEAMACGCPIVSVDVGDVVERTHGVEGCYVAKTFEPEELSGLLSKALMFSGKTNGRERIINDKLDNKLVAANLMEVYRKVTRTDNN